MNKLIAAAAILVLAACAGMTEQSATSARAVLNPTQGNKVSGTVTFTQQGDKVRVVAHLSGLTPGPHGFHVHEKGDCSAPDATSAGGHFNPLGKPHGDVHSPERHAGDLGNLTAGQDGSARLDLVAGDLAVAPAVPTSVIGRAVVVHANADDLKSQPAGNSGPRVACGVIAAVAAPAPPPPTPAYRY